MPAKKKKQPKNSFYFFMVDLRDDFEREGRHYNMKQMADLAGPKWTELSMEEKLHYEEMAKQEKARANNYDGKLDTYGYSIEENIRREEEEARQESEMGQDIQRYIQCLGSKEDIAQEKFYFLSSKVFCRTEEHDYIPAEIGLVEYSIQEGITQYYQKFIDPGGIPTGYAFLCKETSELFKVPYQNFDKASDDYEGIMTDIEDKINPDRSTDSYPPVYCLPEEIVHTKYVLEWLQNRGRMRRRVALRVYDVSMLMVELLKCTAKSMMTVGIVRGECLTSDLYKFNPKTCCSWHWETDAPLYCALGTVRNIGYIFSDYLCDEYNVALKPNRHVPESEDGCSSYHIEPPRRPINTPVKFTPITNDGAIVRNVRSKFSEQEDKYYIPSACSSAMSNTSTVNTSEQGSTRSEKIEPLRQPKFQSFAAASHPMAQARSQFKLDDDDFPSLGSQSSESRCSSVSSFNVSTSSWASRQFQSTPIGRGIGRGRPVAK